MRLKLLSAQALGLENINVLSLTARSKVPPRREIQSGEIATVNRKAKCMGLPRITSFIVKKTMPRPLKVRKMNYR